MVRHFICASLKVGPHKKTRRGWDLWEALLLVPDLKVLHSPTMQGMLQGWAATSAKLDFDFHDRFVPSSASMDQVLILSKKSFGVADIELR